MWKLRVYSDYKCFSWRWNGKIFLNITLNSLWKEKGQTKTKHYCLHQVDAAQTGALLQTLEINKVVQILMQLADACQAAASSLFACVLGHLSSGAVGRSSVRSADSWVMSLLWAVALRSRKSARWSRRWTSRRSWLHAEVRPGGRSPPLRDRETNEKIKLPCL